MKKPVFLFLVALISQSAYAEFTGKGKIIFTQGHTAPSCRTVLHKVNKTGKERYFRIANVTGDDDVGSIVLSALISKRDVDIYYEPDQKSGCGNEPRIIYITVY